MDLDDACKGCGRSRRSASTGPVERCDDRLNQSPGRCIWRAGRAAPLVDPSAGASDAEARADELAVRLMRAEEELAALRRQIGAAAAAAAESTAPGRSRTPGAPGASDLPAAPSSAPTPPVARNAPAPAPPAPAVEPVPPLAPAAPAPAGKAAPSANPLPPKLAAAIKLLWAAAALAFVLGLSTQFSGIAHLPGLPLFVAALAYAGLTVPLRRGKRWAKWLVSPLVVVQALLVLVAVLDMRWSVFGLAPLPALLLLIAQAVCGVLALRLMYSRDARVWFERSRVAK